MPKSKQIFFDPDRKRWRRLRLVLDTSVIVITLLGVFFVATIIRGSSVPGVLLPGVKKPYHALKAVSYTHLRAHETVLDLVCRLLLEKKKNTITNLLFLVQL